MSYLYAGLYSTSTNLTKVARVNLSTFTRDSVLTLAAGHRGWGRHCMVIHGNYLYLATYKNNAGYINVAKVTLSDFSTIAYLDTEISGSPDGMTVFDDYLYISGGDGNEILKIDLSTFTLVSTLALSAGKVFGSLLAIDGYLYICGATLGGNNYIFKVDLSDFTEDSKLEVSKAPYDLTTFSIEVAGTTYKILVVSEDDVVEYIDTATFTSLEDDNFAGRQYAVDLTGTHMYLVDDSSPADIQRINLATLGDAGELELSSGSNVAYDVLVVGNSLYVGLYVGHGLTGKISKINLTTFTEVSTLTLESGDGSVMVLAVPESKYHGSIVIDQLIYQHAERMA